MSRTEKITGLLFAAFFAVGAIGHQFPSTFPLMVRSTPIVLVLSGLIAFLPVMRTGWRSLMLYCALTFLATFFFEAVGTATGAIFGPYTYGDTLGPKLLGVPPVIAFNWVIIILAAVSLAGRIAKRPVVYALFTGALALVYDFVMEPTAIRLDYWHWHTAHIPMQNYGAWFLIAAIAGLIAGCMKWKIKTLVPVLYVAVSFLFFVGLSVFPPSAVD